MHDTLRFWLDRGVDGFRMDVIHCIGKDPALPDVPAERAIIPACALNDFESTHERLREIRRLLDSYPGERVMVGEVGVPWTEIVARYYGQRRRAASRLQLPADLRALGGGRLARADRARGVASSTRAAPGRPGRSRTTTTGATARAMAARRARAPPPCCCSGCAGRRSCTRARSSGSRMPWCPRTGCSIPAAATAAARRFPGSAGRRTVGAAPDPWLPWPPEAERRNVAAQREDAGSILHLYRRLLAARRGSPALREGSFAWLDSPAGVLAWERAVAGDRRIVLVNFTSQPAAVKVPGAWRVEVASDGRGEGAPYADALAPDAALVLAARYGRSEHLDARRASDRRRRRARRPGRSRSRPPIADQKPLIVKCSSRAATRPSMAALITSRNRPSVRIVIGRVTKISSGRTIAFTKPSSSAAIQSVAAPWIRMPGHERLRDPERERRHRPADQEARHFTSPPA